MSQLRLIFFADNYFLKKLERTKDLKLISIGKNPGPMKEFLKKFFDLCKEYQEQIPPHKIAEVQKDYAERLDD